MVSGLFLRIPLFSLDMATWCNGLTRQLADQVAIEDVVVLLYKSHETAATFPWSTIDPRILAWPANGACFNHLLLVNTSL